MTSKSRRTLIAVAVLLPMVGACAENPTGPAELKVRRDTTYDSLVALGCGDNLPWGKAPCLGQM